ncbi:MAG: hypothetical protein KKE20_06885 [Nanoarchaeota archaeon]|nr:hypothetical protein [Nanoarchaeota archaeon]
MKFEGVVEAQRVYAARSQGSPDAQIWVVDPKRMNPRYCFDTVAYVFLGGPEDPGVLRQMNARVRHGSIWAVKPILFNTNGTSFLYTSGLKTLKRYFGRTKDIEPASALGDMLEEGYQTLDGILEKNPGLNKLPAKVLSLARGFNLAEYLQSRQKVVVKTKPGKEMPIEFYY